MYDSAVILYNQAIDVINCYILFVGVEIGTPTPMTTASEIAQGRYREREGGVKKERVSKNGSIRKMNEVRKRM